MPTISLCMIVRDEEKSIAQCLTSVQGVVEEIIVVDTGSKDETKRVASGFGAKIIDFIWTGSFADARNASLEAANGDWILFLDADEYLEPNCHSALRTAVAHDNVEGYYIPFINIYGSEEHPEECKDVLFRLFRNRSGYRFCGIIHEQVLNSILEKDSNATICVAHDITIFHYGYLYSKVQEKDKIKRNLELLAQQLTVSPDDKYVLYQYGLELYRAERYGESIEMLKKSLTGLVPGGPESMYFPKLVRLLAMAHYQAGKYEEAVERVNYGLSIFPDYADLYYYGGLCLYELRAYGTSFEYFSKAANQGEQAYVYGSYPGVRGCKSYFYMGKICEEFGNEEEALGYYLAGFRDNSAFTMILEQMVRILVKGEESNDVKIALANICECCTPEANYVLGRILFSERSFKLAEEYLAAAATGGLKAADADICRAICLAQQDRAIEALKLLDEYVNDSEHSVRAMYNKAVVFWLQDNSFKVRSVTDSLMKLGLDEDFEAIVKLLRIRPSEHMEPVSLQPDSSELLFDILLRAMDHGSLGKVEEILARMHHEWIKVHACRLMQMYLKHNKLNEAERFGNIYLAGNHNCFDSLVYMGDIKCQKQEYWEAAEYYRAAVNEDTGRPKAYINLLKVYDRLCLETLKTAVEKHPDVELFKMMLEQEAAR